MTDEIIKKLKKNIELTKKNKSSHWQKFLKSKNHYDNKFSNSGYGSYKRKVLTIFYKFFLKLIFGKQIFKTDTYKKFKSILIK